MMSPGMDETGVCGYIYIYIYIYMPYLILHNFKVLNKLCNFQLFDFKQYCN